MNTVLKCKNCGSDLEENTKFCGKCGSLVETEPVNIANPAVVVEEPPAENPVQENADAYAAPPVFIPVPPPVQPAQPVQENPQQVWENPMQQTQQNPVAPKPQANLKKYIKPAVIILAVLVVIAIAIPVLLTVTASEKYPEFKGTVFLHETDDSVIIMSGSYKTEIDGCIRDGDINIDGTKLAVLIGDDYYSNDGYALYYFDGKTCKKIADEVYDLKLSSSGNGIIYIKERDYYEDTEELWIYTDGKSQKIAANLSYDYEMYCISPNGKTVGYYSDSDMGYIWDGKSNKELGKNKIPMAVSDGGKYIYFIRKESLYVQRGMNEDSAERLESDINNIYSIFTNKDLSQIIVSNSDKSYISVNGGERRQLASPRAYDFIIPEGTEVMQYYTGYGDYIFILGIDSFAGTFFMNYNDSIMYINKNYESTGVAKNVDEAKLARDGKTLIYLKDGNIYKVNGALPDASSASVQLTKDDYIRTFKMQKDGGAVYYIDGNYELFYQKGAGKAVRICDEVEYYDFGIFNKNKNLYYIFDDELYVSSGQKGTKIKAFQGDVTDIQVSMYPFYSYIVIETRDGNEINTYISTDGTKFELVATRDSSSGTWDDWDYEDWDWD